MAYQRGMLTLAERERVFKVMGHLGLPLWHEVCDDHEMLWQVRPRARPTLLLVSRLAWRCILLHTLNVRQCVTPVIVAPGSG